MALLVKNEWHHLMINGFNRHLSELTEKDVSSQTDTVSVNLYIRWYRGEVDNQVLIATETLGSVQSAPSSSESEPFSPSFQLEKHEKEKLTKTL